MGPKKKGKGKEEPEVKNKEDETEQVITKYTLIYIYQCWRSFQREPVKNILNGSKEPEAGRFRGCESRAVPGAGE